MRLAHEPVGVTRYHSTYILIALVLYERNESSHLVVTYPCVLLWQSKQHVRVKVLVVSHFP